MLEVDIERYMLRQDILSTMQADRMVQASRELTLRHALEPIEDEQE